MTEAGPDGGIVLDPLAAVKVDKTALAAYGGGAKALLFLVSLDERVATRVLAQLSDAEVRKLRESSTMLTEAPAAAIRAVHYEFLSRAREGLPASLKGSHAYLRRLAGNALGEGRAAALWRDNADGDAAAMARLDVGVLEALLADEQPQTAALILSQLPSEKSAAVVGKMDPARRNDVLLRVAQLESVPEHVLDEVQRVFEKHADTFSTLKRHEIPGKRAAADILKRLPDEVGEEVLESLRSTHSEAAEEIEKALFTFEDLVRIDSRGMQQLLKEVATDQLVVALKTASDELKEKVFGNVSSRAASLLHEELELMGAVRLSEVEEAQHEIIQTALNLEKEGRIVIAREGGGDYV